MRVPSYFNWPLLLSVAEVLCCAGIRLEPMYRSLSFTLFRVTSAGRPRFFFFFFCNEITNGRNSESHKQFAGPECDLESSPNCAENLVWQARRFAYKRNIEARSRNHCCSGLATEITYSECVSVALVIQYAKRMRRAILSPARLNDTFQHYLINGTIFGGGGGY